MSQATRALVLFKRHTKDCAVHKSRVPIDKQRFWMQCDCAIWIHGRTPNGSLVPRQSTGFSDLKRAEALRLSLLEEARDERAGIESLANCIDKYLASRRSQLGDKAYGQTKLLLTRLQDYFSKLGLYAIGDMSADVLEQFKVEGLPTLVETSRSTAVSKLRCFLRHAYRRGWTADALVERVTPTKAVYEQKIPYEPDEVKKILDEALNLKGGRAGYAKQPKTFRLLMELMLETGMRVGDAIQFDPAKLVRGERLWIYSFNPQKKKLTEKMRTIEVFLTDRLKTEIDGCTWLSSTLPFWFPAAASAKNPSYLPNEVYARMQAIGARCGVADCRPHRLRDTFAVEKLLAGMHLEDVSRLLGHSSTKITETYYGRWTARRKVRLERLLAETLVNS